MPTICRFTSLTSLTLSHGRISLDERLSLVKKICANLSTNQLSHLKISHSPDTFASADIIRSALIHLQDIDSVLSTQKFFHLRSVVFTFFILVFPRSIPTITDISLEPANEDIPHSGAQSSDPQDGSVDVPHADQTRRRSPLNAESLMVDRFEQALARLKAREILELRLTVA